MWILSCGMIRSGSTLQYQIIKELIEMKALGKGLGWINAPSDFYSLVKNTPNHETNVIKVHNFTPELKKILLTTNHKLIFIYRDVRDALVSLMTKEKLTFKKTFNGYFVDMFFNNFNNWMKEKNIYVSRYEEIVNNLGKEISGIASFLNIDLTSDELEMLKEKLSISNQKKSIKQFTEEKDFVMLGTEKFNQDSLLHTNHIHSGEQNQWKHRLSGLEVAYTEYYFNKWLKENGYAPAYPRSVQRSAYYFNRILQRLNLY